MEKSENVYTILSDFGWNDLGTWQSIYDVFDKDKAGMVIQGNVYSFNSKNSIIYSKNKLTAIIGVDNLVVVNTDDATLVMSMKEAERVKEIVNKLNTSGRDEYL